MTILVTGSNLTNLESLKDDPRHVFVQGGIGGTSLVSQLLPQYKLRVVALPSAKDANAPTLQK